MDWAWWGHWAILAEIHKQNINEEDKKIVLAEHYIERISKDVDKISEKVISMC